MFESLWQHREVSTAVLRPVNVIGPDLGNLMSRLLRLRRCPKLLGYDPLMQFIHQQDLARAVVLAVRRPEKNGVFNVGGEGTVAWSRAIRISGSRMWLVPRIFAEPATAIADTFRHVFPRHLLPYFPYPTIVDDKLFRAEFGFEPQLTTVETLQSVKQRGSK
ncbi:MAG: NAD-dependent epimerase/dehydratase family protein [Proteobacteria bacterium]|jgi:UDP-glucose 4-epimerase|nr:NAD-dependent epimerase/dehydratase family protein [Pseudomonadota bacterium]